MRFIARQEFNGALFLDTLNDRPLKLNRLSYTILKELSRVPLPVLLEQYPADNREVVNECIAAMKKSGILDEHLQLNTLLIPPVPSLDCFSAPVRVYLNLTNRCNLRCRHCVNESGPGQEAELPFTEVHSLIDEMSRLGVFELVIGGGEVFLYKRIVDVIREANQKNIPVGMTTNGHLIDKALCEKIAHLSFRYLSVSFDGATAETHEYIRGPGSFSKALSGIKNLINYTSHRVSLHLVIMQHNIGEIEQVFELAEDLGCDIGIDFVKPAGRILQFPELILNRDQYIEALDLLHNTLIPRSSIKAHLPHRCYPSRGKKTRFIDNFGCGAAQTNCGVDCRGNVLPCNFLAPSGRVDNIREKSLQHIWLHNEEFKRLRSIKMNETCASCNFMPNCRGGCRANVPSCAPFNSPDPLCLKGSLFDKS